MVDSTQLVQSITDSRRVHPTVNPQVKLWADILPSSWRPFVQLSRVDMISGSLLMFWPCVWSLLAAGHKAELPITDILVQLPAYFFGSVLLHSIACTWNDVCDKDLDAKVERTKHRPLASGKVSVTGALVFGVAQVAVFLLLLTQLRQSEAVNAMLFGLGVWQPIYPFMKRITYWPQAWLPFVMNWGIVIAWLDNTHIEDAKTIVSLFIASCCWSIYYDTVYATMDVKDDVRIGVKSTAVLFGSRVRGILAIFCLGLVGSLTYFGLENKQGMGYFILSVFLTAVLLTWQLITWDVNVPQSSFARFDQNGRWVGALIASGFVYDYVSRLIISKLA